MTRRRHGCDAVLLVSLTVAGCSGESGVSPGAVALFPQAAREANIAPDEPRVGATAVPVAATGTSATTPVTLIGIYQQWRGSCVGAPPVARADWMLDIDGKCLYVHAPLPAVERGARVKVTGVEKALPDGRRYIDATKVDGVTSMQ